MAGITGSIAQQQDEFVTAFNAVGDSLLQYDMLIAMYSTLPRLLPEEKMDANLIQGCTSKVWLVCGYEDSRVRLRMESEALIVGGIAGVIVQLLDNRTPEEILAAEVDFIQRTSLAQDLSTDRRHGMGHIVSRIRSFAQGILNSRV